MVLRVLYIILISLIWIATSAAQTVHVEYKKFIVPGQTEYGRWMSSPEMQRRMREREEQMASHVSEYFDLYSDGTRSYFEYDTTVSQIARKEEERGWWSRMEGVHFSHAKNLQNGQVTVRSDILADSVCRTVDFRDKYHWKMAEGEKIFANLLCQKAFHITEEKDSIIIWFAPELPIADGPEDFAGAPGMILAVEAPAFNYIAETVQLGDFDIPKAPINPEHCLKEEAFRERVREEMIRKYINEK